MEKVQLLNDEEQQYERPDPALKRWHMSLRGTSMNSCLLAVNIAVLILSIVLNISTWQHSHVLATATCTKSTDMEDARSAIQYELRTFTGALLYDPETKRAYNKQDSERQYFGPPGQELNDAWNDLLRGEFPIMTEEEAAPYQPALRRIPKTKHFHFEPDIFHTLHCVNAVRLEVSKTLYNVSMDHHHEFLGHTKLPEGWDTVHLEHCMDRIRQSIMCAGDLTPSPMYIWDGFNIALGRSGEHTCRKWEPIREWMDQRGKRGPLLG